MIIPIPEDTSCQPPMRFDLQRPMFNQPFSDYVRPAKRKRQKHYQLLQSLWRSYVRLLQRKPSRLHTSKQRLYLPSSGVIRYSSLSRLPAGNYQIFSRSKFHPADVKILSQQPACSFKRYWLADAKARKQATGRDCLPSPIGYLRISSHANAKINLFVGHVSKPLFANKFAVRAQIRDAIHAKQAIKLFQQIDAFSRVRAALLFKNAPQKRECYAFIADAERHHIKRSRAQVPIGSIKCDDPGGRQCDQLDNKESNLSVADFKQPQKALHPFVARSGLCWSAESVSHLSEVYGLDLDERDKELSQEVDAGFVPGYIIGKRSLQKANVGHCVLSFQDSFGDDLVKDSGTMAFYAFSKIDFCPVLRQNCLRSAYCRQICRAVSF
jgi:hypothetical protein